MPLPVKNGFEPLILPRVGLKISPVPQGSREHAFHPSRHNVLSFPEV